MKYIRSERYGTPELMKKIMGPNPVKLEEELLRDTGFRRERASATWAADRG